MDLHGKYEEMRYVKELVNYNIYNQDGKFIFGTSGIQIMEVDANLDLSVLLEDGNNIGHPIRMLFFPDEARVYKLLDFRFDYLHYLWTVAVP